MTSCRERSRPFAFCLLPSAFPEYTWPFPRPRVSSHFFARGADRRHGHGKARFALQTPRILVPVERDLRRAQRLLGLWPPGRRAEAERQGVMVARHGHRARRPGRAARGPDDLRDDRHRLHDHHASAGLEVLGPLRPVPRLHGRLPREQASLPPRSGPRTLGRGQGTANLRRHPGRRRRGPGRHRAAGAQVFQPSRQERRRAHLAGTAGLADHRGRLCPGVGARGQDLGHTHAAARIQPDVQNLRRR